MMNDSIKLAKLWTKLNAVKDKIDNEIIPASGHLDIEDPELMVALEEVSAKIANHFERFKLAAGARKS